MQPSTIPDTGFAVWTKLWVLQTVLGFILMARELYRTILKSYRQRNVALDKVIFYMTVKIARLRRTSSQDVPTSGKA